MQKEIALRRLGKVIVKQGDRTEPLKMQLGVLVEAFGEMGYKLSKKLLKVLETLDEGYLEQFYKETVDVLNKLNGNDKLYDPMYRNFPKEVNETTKVNLYINAYIHYISDGNLFPISQKEQRTPLQEQIVYKTIDLATEEEFMDIFKNLMAAKTSLSPTDLEDLTWFIDMYPNYKDYLPEEIPFKENLALIGKCIFNKSILPDTKFLSKYFKTAIDVLRLITALSDGDLSLARNTHYRSFKRSERRVLLELLEGCHNIEEDMVRYTKRWIRIGERLHPGEYVKAYPYVTGTFNKLRNNEKIWTYYGKIARAIESEDEKELLALLQQRPGEFARRLDHILRISKSPQVFIRGFKEVSHQVATTVLLQVRQHFKDRKNQSECRIYFPKGNTSKARMIEKPLSPLDDLYCRQIEEICTEALIQVYSEKEPLGKVYISESYKNYIIPFAQRSASKTLNTVTRGSKFKINVKDNTLRSFIWWKNGDTRTDIDLSLTAYNDNWEYVDHISYTNLKSDELKAYHSGDIVDAPQGASEFIDIDLSVAKEKRIHYLITSIQCFTGQRYCDLPECFMGWMNRRESQSGDVYEPSLVENKIDLASDGAICIPFIIDLEEEMLIWADMVSTEMMDCPINIEGNQGGILLACQSVANLSKPNLYELIQLHIMARGEKTLDKEDANYIFDEKEGIKPSQIELFMAQYL